MIVLNCCQRSGSVEGLSPALVCVDVEDTAAPIECAAIVVDSAPRVQVVKVVDVLPV